MRSRVRAAIVWRVRGPMPVPLSARQRQVMVLLATGKSRKEIAGILGVCLQTVDYHCGEIEKKIGSCDPAVMAHYALGQNMIRRMCFIPGRAPRPAFL